ncbi:MAG TPA: hypothetical protein VFU46_06805 [Gemmatimonadales bacterium]|nr:hypothetical protein [Gemmatimonadales bacterium]
MEPSAAGSAVRPSGRPAVFRDVVVIGGGCYGTFYAGQLARARDRGAAAWDRLIVVDRNPQCRAARELPPDPTRALIASDWDGFFDRYLAQAAVRDADPGRADAIVPSPLMPHLMFDWLLRSARRRWPARAVHARPAELAAGMPYDVLHPTGTRYLSFADWLCPVHCVEPATCPVTHAPRTWEMADAVTALAGRLARRGTVRGPALFVCRHRVYGVGMFDVAEVLAGDALVTGAGAPGTAVDVVVGTVSSCHGAVSVLHLGDAAPPASVPSRGGTSGSGFTAHRSPLYLAS